MERVEYHKALIVGAVSVTSVYAGLGILAYWLGSFAGIGLLASAVALTTLGALGMGGSSAKMHKNRG